MYGYAITLVFLFENGHTCHAKLVIVIFSCSYILISCVLNVDVVFGSVMWLASAASNRAGYSIPKGRCVYS